MKRFAPGACALACLVVFGLGRMAQAQKWYFYESFNAVSVNASGAGDVPSGFTLYNDNYTPYEGKPDLSHFDKAWKVIRGMDGEGRVSAPSLFKGSSAAANRWLITPAIALSGAVSPKLYFRAKSDDERTLDGFTLKISTTTTDSTAFKNLRAVRETKAKWTDYVFDLKEYVNQTVYIAFVQNSIGMYTVSIDDIRVAEAAENSVAAACNNAFAPLYMIHTNPQSNMPFPVTATLQNWGSQPITSARLCARIKDDSRVISKTLSGLNIAAASDAAIASKTVTLDFVPSDEDDDAQIEIWFDQINGGNAATEHSIVPCYIAEEDDMPCKKVMMEIFSSSTCSNCGPWNKAFHAWDTLSNTFGKKDGFVVAKFQVDIPVRGDKLVTDETLARSNFYGINAAPYWNMNGRRFALNGGSVENTNKTLNNIADSILAFRKIVVPFDLSVKLQREGNKFTVQTKTEVELPFMGKYRLYIALCEDSVHFATAGMSEEHDFFNVVRKMIPNVNGLALDVKQPTEENNDFETTHTYTVGENPIFYDNLDKVGVVAYIQNEDTREIIQAAFAKANGEWSENAPWLNDKTYKPLGVLQAKEEAVADAVVYPNPVSDEATLKFRALGQENLTVCLLDMQGREMWRKVVSGGSDWQTVALPTSGLKAGLYIVRMESADGRTSIKLLKK